MNNNNDIAERLASRLKSERRDKGLSLEALAKLSGVSRSMLSQIERGESSPTVASLWNLTRALNVDFAGLLDDSAGADHAIHELVRAEEAPVIARTQAGYTIRILSAPGDVGETEIYDITFAPGGAMDSQPHAKGCTESLTVLEGGVEVRSGDEKVSLRPGDTVRYAADIPHSISAGQAARVLLVVKNP